MTPSEKRILVLKGFEDELQKHAGVVSAIWKGTKALFGKGVQKATDPKVQKAVKEKIKHHADDIAVVGTGAAGYGVYKGLTNNKEQKSDQKQQLENTFDTLQKDQKNIVKKDTVNVNNNIQDSSKVVKDNIVQDSTKKIVSDNNATKDTTVNDKKKKKVDTKDLFNMGGSAIDSIRQSMYE